MFGKGGRGDKVCGERGCREHGAGEVRGEGADEGGGLLTKLCVVESAVHQQLCSALTPHQILTLCCIPPLTHTHILPQAQRDFFGSHTYQRTDKEGWFHTVWDENFGSADSITTSGYVA